METTLIIVAIIAAIPPTLAVLLAWYSTKRAVKEVHLLVNSRMDELLKSAKGEATAEGREIGRAENNKI